MATIIAVDKGQDWKYGERLMRDSWSGDWVLEKTWQQYYAVTAQWTNPQTQQQYVFSGQRWVNETTVPVVGASIPVIIHPRKPSRYEIIFKL